MMIAEITSIVGVVGKKRTPAIVGIIGIIGTVSECQANIIYWYRLLQQAVVTRASARFLNN